MHAFAAQEFIRDSWSKFDLFIIITSWLSQGLEDYGGAWQSTRSLRVLRITLVVKKAKTLCVARGSVPGCRALLSARRC